MLTYQGNCLGLVESCRGGVAWWDSCCCLPSHTTARALCPRRSLQTITALTNWQLESPRRLEHLTPQTPVTKCCISRSSALHHWVTAHCITHHSTVSRVTAHCSQRVAPLVLYLSFSITRPRLKHLCLCLTFISFVASLCVSQTHNIPLCLTLSLQHIQQHVESPVGLGSVDS